MKLCTLFWATGTVAILMAAASARPSEARDQQVEVIRDAEEGLTYIRVPAHRGRVRWADVGEALAAAMRLDNQEARKLLPPGSIDLRRRSAHLSLKSASLLLPGIRLQQVGGDDDDPLALLVTIDRHKVRAKWREAKDATRALVGRDGRGEVQIQLDEDWRDAQSPRPKVLFLHGLNSSPEVMSQLVAQIRRRGYRCGTVNYPNDQAVARTAKELAKQLRRLGEEDPHSSLALITHSMGGLVAREMVEATELDPGNIARLIMIAPPNHGTDLARLAYGLDVWEHLLGTSDGSADARFYRSIEDGLAEAADDLKPDSAFLRALNARPRNARIDYTIVLGKKGLISGRQLFAIRKVLSQAAQRQRHVRLFGPRLDAIFADLDEVVVDKGDGVVAVQSGRLDGVADVHVLDCDHFVLGSLDSDVGRALLDIVLQRLGPTSPQSQETTASSAID